MKCFAKYDETDLECVCCKYCDACIFAKDYDAKVKKSNGSYNSRSGGGKRQFIDNLICEDEKTNIENSIKLLSEPNQKATFSYSEVITLIDWLLKIMDSDVLRAVLKLRLKSNIAIAKIAEKQGKSRQRLHWQIKKELNKIFGVDNTKNSKNRIK